MTTTPSHSASARASGSATSWLKRLGLFDASPAIDKAGMVVHGMLSHDPLTGEALSKSTHYVVAPWSQGRFSDGDGKLYFLAKGSVDVGERSIDAALRESYEETGVNVGAIADGMVPGVVMAGEMPMPYEREILGSSGHPWQTQMFFQEVTGIDRLKPFLKNSTAQFAGRFSERVTEHSKPYHRKAPLPSFDDMLHWLRSGVMPAGHWNEGKHRVDTGLASRSKFAQLERDTMSLLIEERMARGCNPLLPGRASGDVRAEILNPVEFGIFRDRLARRDCEWLDARLKQMKSALNDMKIVGDDHSDIKLDMKERPLQFYQEGADLLPVSEYLTRIINQSHGNARYDRNMVGAHGDGKYKHGVNHHLVNALGSKEIAMLVPIIQPQDIDDADITPALKYALRGLVAQYQAGKETSGLSR